MTCTTLSDGDVNVLDDIQVVILMTCTTLSDGDVNVLDDIQVVDDVYNTFRW